MKRKYILTVRVEATFARKVKSSQHKQELLKRLKAVDLPHPWEITTASIKSHAMKTGKTVEKLKKEHEEVVVRKRSRKSERLQEARQVEKEIGQRVRERLAEVREIAAAMKKAMPRTFPVPILRAKECGMGKTTYGHAHNSYRDISSKTICMNPNFLLWASRRQLESTTAHELGHLVKPGKGRGHSTKKFQDRQAKTLEAYCQARGETWEPDEDYTGWIIQKETNHRFQEGDRVKVHSVYPALIGKVGDVIGVEDDGTVAVELDGRFYYIRSNSLRKVD